jgi:histidine kinase
MKPWYPPALKKIFHSLTLKLGFSVGLIVFLTVLGYAYFLLKTQENQAVQKILSTAGMFSDTLRKGTHYSMLKYQPEALHKIIEAVGQQSGVELIRIFNKKGAIMYSTRKAEVGQTVNMQAEACYSCHQRDKVLERLPVNARSRIFSSDNRGRVMGFINPIYNEESCSTAACHAHPADQTVLGVIDVVLSLSAVDREIKKNSSNILIFALFFFLGAFGLVGFCIYFFVDRPIGRLRQGTREIAAGDFDHPVAIHSSDEIGDLAEAFEEMRQKIQETTTALRKSQQEFQTLFESVPCYITVQDRNLRLLRTNRDFRKDFGAIIGAPCFEVYKGRQEKCPQCKVEQTFQTGTVYSGEETVTTKNGEKAHILVYTAPVYNENNEITSVMELSVNVTNLKVLEEELCKSEEAYRLLFNNDPSPIFVVDQASFKILDANARALDLYRYDKPELLTKTFLDLVPEDSQEELLAFFKGKMSFLGKVKQCRQGGFVFYVNLRASQGVYLDTAVYIITTNDITERIQAEQQLAQASKMATLGELSAGVAHELNQPLTVIKMGSTFILRKIREKQPIPEETLVTLSEEMDAQVDRASRIINHLREFGRKTDINKIAVQVNEAIQGMLTVMGKQLELRQIRLALELDPDLPKILGDKNRLEQVFINLAMNARDALDDPNRTGKTIRIRSTFEKGQVRIDFEDNGSGIPKEIQDKIFEPFFSTKGVGQGTGLGLSISYGIVRDYQGSIQVKSQEDRGTTFSLFFPPYRDEG